MADDKKIDDLKNYILEAEKSLEAAKKALFDLTGEDLNIKSAKPSKVTANLTVADGGKIIEGIFDGENMVGPEGKVFPVPANYASKSKLIEGDRLKLTVAEDGSFIFKQIGPAERKKLIGELSFENNMYTVAAEGKNYHLLYAAVTYHKAKPGDRVTIVVPANEDTSWAALENVIHNVAEQGATVATEPKEENILAEEPKDDAIDSFFDTDTPVDESAPINNSAPASGVMEPMPEVVPEPVLPSQPAPEVNPDPAPNIIQPAPAQSPAIKSDPYPSELAQEGNLGAVAGAMPDESFLPRTQDDTSNSMGEVSPTVDPSKPEEVVDLEI